MGTRRERVILDLEDHFSREMVKPIAATKALDAALDSLSGSAVKSARGQEDATKATKGLGDETEKTSKKTKEYTLEQAIADEKTRRLRKSLQDQAKAHLDVGDAIDDENKSLRTGSRDLDRYSGRLALLAEAAVILGPALVPIGAVAVPAVVALAAGLGAAAGAAGIAVLAFNGVGDALKALNEYQVEPTQANFEKMRAEMDKLGPAGAGFVRFLDDLEPQFRQLQELARLGLFPGVEPGITSLLDLLPQLRLIVFNLATEMGNLTAEAGEALSGERWAAFFDYLETDAAPTLAAFGHTIGNVTEGLASLFVAFAPLSRDFSSGMESMSRSFADWAANLSRTQGFQDFLDYIRQSGPQVLDLIGALATAFVGIAKAAAPVGAIVVPALTALANILGAIAASPIGGPLFTAAAAMLAINRATTLAAGAMDRFQVSAKRSETVLGRIGRTAAGVTAVGMAVGVMADNIGRIDSANLERSIVALSNGTSTDTIDKIVSSLDDLNKTSNSIDFGEIVTLGGLFGDTTLDKEADNLRQFDQALAQMVESGNVELAAVAMAEVSRRAQEQGVSLSEVKDRFPEYATALANAGVSADAAATAQERYIKANNLAAEVTKRTRTQVEGLNAAMEEQVSAALAAFDAVTQYNRALGDAREQANKSNDGIRLSADLTKKQRLAVLENRDALSQLAGAWNNQGDAVRNNMGRWKAARDEFIRVAVQMGATRKEAEKLADRVMAIPKQRQIDIKLYGSEEAASKIENLRYQLSLIKDKDVRVNYYINTMRSVTSPELHAPRADGGEILGPRYPYRDKVLALLAPGEEVISNRHGQADRFRADRAAGRIPAYAEGGTVGTAAYRERPANWSQLYGITDPRLGAAELANRILGLTGAQFRSLAHDVEGLSKRGLTKLGKALEKATDQAEENTDAARDHVKAVRDDIASVRSSIAERFRSDLFGQGADVTLGNGQPRSLSGETIARITAEQQAAGATPAQIAAAIEAATAKQQADYIATQSRLTAMMQRSPIDILKADIADAKEARGLYEELEDLLAGRDGKMNRRQRLALAYAQQNASNDELSALVADPQLARQYARLYGQRQQVTAGTGQTAAMQRWGDAQEAAVKEFREAKVELRELKQAQRVTNQRLERMERLAEKAPKKTGDAVADALDDVADKAVRGR